MLFQTHDPRLFSVDELIVLLEGKAARNSEFDYDRFELADTDIFRMQSKFYKGESG